MHQRVYHIEVPSCITDSISALFSKSVFPVFGVVLVQDKIRSLAHEVYFPENTAVGNASVTETGGAINTHHRSSRTSTKHKIYEIKLDINHKKCHKRRNTVVIWKLENWFLRPLQLCCQVLMCGTCKFTHIRSGGRKPTYSVGGRFLRLVQTS
jgi:hypothetical protein